MATIDDFFSSVKSFKEQSTVPINGFKYDQSKLIGVAGPVGGVASAISSQLPKLAALFAAGATAAVIAPPLSEEIKKIQKGPEYSMIANSQIGQDISLRQMAQQGFSRGVDIAAQGQGIPVSRIQDVLPTRSLRQDVLTEGFKPVYRELLNRGYSNQDAQKIANVIIQQEAARESGALGFTLSPEALANISGSVISRRVLPKVVTRGGERVILRAGESLAPSRVQQTIFSLPGIRRLKFLQSDVATASGRIASRAGVIEGTSSVLSEDISRRQFGQQEEGLTTGALGLEKGSIGAKAVAQTERILTGGIAGSIVAKPLGFIIGGQYLPRPKVSKLYEITGDIIDAPELPGDILTSWAAKRLKVSPNRVRVITISPSQTNVLTGETTKGSAAIAVVPSKEDILTQSNEPFVSPRASASLDTIFQPVPPPPIIPDVVTPPENTSDNPMQLNDEVPANTPVNSIADVFAQIPTKSNIYRGGFPIIPPLGGPGTGFRGGGRPARTRFINELDLLSGLVGSQFRRPTRRQQISNQQDIITARKNVRRFLRKNPTSKPLTQKEKQRFFELTGERL